MIFAQFWWTLLVFNSLGSSCLPMAGGQLQRFSRAVDLAGPELQDLWSSFGDQPESLDQMEQSRERRNALDGKFTDKAKSPVEGSKVAAKDTRNWEAEADAWYQKFRVKMAKRNAITKRMTEKKERTLAKSVTDEDMRLLGAQADAWYRDWIAKRAKEGAKLRLAGSKVERSSRQEERKAIEQHNQPAKRRAKPKKASEEATVQKPEQTPSLFQAEEGSAASQDNVKLKNKPQTIGQQENFQAQSRVKVKAAPEKVDDPLEKLQESRSAQAPLDVYHKTKSNKLDHEANYKLSKIEQEASEKIPKLQKNRRSPVCDPMEEVKLKTSSRLIAKGFGPLLPSETYLFTRKSKLEDWQNRLLYSTLGRNQPYEPLKNLDLQPENLESAADLPPTLDYKEPPYDRFYPLDQQKKPNVFDFDRPKRKPNKVEIKSEPSLSTFSHANVFDRPKRKPNNVETKNEPSLSTYSHVDLSESDQELSPKQAVGEPFASEGQVKTNRARSALEREEDQNAPQQWTAINLSESDQELSPKQAVGEPFAPEGQVKTHRVRSALEGEEDQNAPQQWTAVNTQLSDINRATETREHESKDTLPKLQQELHEDTKLYRAALAKPSGLKGSDEEQLKTDAKPVAPNINMSPEATSRLQPNQETRARRFPRRTRRVKRSLEEQHVATRQRLDDFEDHNGNRASFGILGNGLLTPDAKAELGGEFLSFPGHELLAYNELKGSQHHPIRNLVSMMNVSPKTLYHHHEPLRCHPRKSNFKGYTNLNQLNDLQKFLQVQQNILQATVGVFFKNADLLDPTKFKPKTQVAKTLLLQYQDLPLLDQLKATDLLAQDLEELLKTAINTVHHVRDVFLYKVLEGVIEEQKNTKPSSRFLKFLNVAELLKDDSEQQTWDMLAVE